jgi:hypothetical protein
MGRRAVMPQLENANATGEMGEFMSCACFSGLQSIPKTVFENEKRFLYERGKSETR